MPREAFAGIDVACAKNQRLPIAIVVRDADGRARPLRLRGPGLPLPPCGAGNVRALDDAWLRGFACDVELYLSAVQAYFRIQIQRLAIDAPSDPCAPGLRRRLAEAALDARGISCFATPTEAAFEVIKTRARAHLARGGLESCLPHANQLWMLVGFALFRRLRERFECMEVYPQAIVTRLGAHRIHKSKPDGLLAQLRAFRERTGWPEADPTTSADLAALGYGKPHDNLDACLSAWVASLPEAERTPYGVAPNDVIWVPRG